MLIESNIGMEGQRCDQQGEQYAMAVQKNGIFGDFWIRYKNDGYSALVK